MALWSVSEGAVMTNSPPDRQQQDRLDVLRAMIDEAEASGISERCVEEILAEACTIAKSHRLLKSYLLGGS
jgi:hypothetical protein